MPVRLEAALTAMDTDRDGHIDVDEWCVSMNLGRLRRRASKTGPSSKKKQIGRARRQARARRQERCEGDRGIHERVPPAARRCFELIDKDGGGTLSTAEIVEAVKSDAEVIDFLKNCGEENLQFLLHPPRLKKALAVLDEDKSGEIDVEECAARRLTYIRTPRVGLSEAPASLVDVRTGETAIQKGLAHRLEQLSIERQRRDRANARADEEFSAEFLSAARAVFLMIDKDIPRQRDVCAPRPVLQLARVAAMARGRRPLIRIDATRPPDSRAASRPSEQIKK